LRDSCLPRIVALLPAEKLARVRSGVLPMLSSIVVAIVMTSVIKELYSCLKNIPVWQRDFSAASMWGLIRV